MASASATQEAGIATATMKATARIACDCSAILQRSGRLQETLIAILCSPPATLSTKDLWEIAHESAALSAGLQAAERTATSETSISVGDTDTSADAIMGRILLTFHKAHWNGCVRAHRSNIITLLRALVEHLLVEVDPTWPALRPWSTLVGVHNALLEQTTSQSQTQSSLPTGPPAASVSVSSQQRPPKRLSLTALLQMIAQKRADRCCHLLLEWLLEEEPGTGLGETPHWSRKDKLHGLSKHLGDGDIGVATATALNCDDDNSSIEVLRTLADHMSPGGRARAAAVAASAANVSTLTATHPPHVERILRDDTELLNALLTALAACAPAVLGVGAVRRGKIRAAARRKAWRFYQRAAWAAAGTRLEHALLWWRDSSVTIGPKRARRLTERALRYAALSESGAPMCAAALGGLGDALTAYTGVVSWDRRFRTPLVRSWPLKTWDDPAEHGKRWKGLFADLVRLCKACEPGANLEVAPVVEQIPLLHRLDHSLHAFRVWTSARARALAARWEIDALFRTGHADVRACIHVVESLKLKSHKDVVSFNSVHVAVCIKMRAKLVSEIAENISKLQGVPEETVGALAAACRTLSLASLHLTFPEPRYWRRTYGQGATTTAIAAAVESGSPYVRQLLEEILLPVLQASPLLLPNSRSTVCGLVLKVMCDTWLDYIYSSRIKFSELGAAQLLEDFSGVGAWLQSLKGGALNDEQLSRTLLRHEVLRRCEGVARLLLRRPGERIAMGDQTQAAPSSTSQLPPTDAAGAADSCAPAEGSMPAEMYVPNQEQWLKLRASRRQNFCCAPITNYI